MFTDMRGNFDSMRSKVLVVEDNRVTRLIMKKGFSECGIRKDDIVFAETAEQAIERAENLFGELLCIVCDICLKGSLDGLHALSRIRERDGITPVFVVSSTDVSVWRLRAATLDVVAMMQKPISAKTILTLAKEVWKGRCRDSPRRRPSDPTPLIGDWATLLETKTTPRVSTTEEKPQQQQQSSPLSSPKLASPSFSSPALLQHQQPSYLDESLDELGNTPLHFLARCGDTANMRQLLNSADSHLLCRDALNEKGYTALHVACWSGHIECVRMLVEAGWDATRLSIRGFNCYDLGNEEVRTYLHAVCGMTGTIDSENGQQEHQAQPLNLKTPFARINDPTVATPPTTPVMSRQRLPRRRSLSGVTLPVLLPKNTI